jgi:hypothetical protein
MRTRLRHFARFLRAIVKHPRLPRWVRYGLVVLLLIPGPVDEALALVVLLAVAVVYRREVSATWVQTR